MPEGPLRGLRLTSFGPFVENECDLTIRDSRLVKKEVDSSLGDKIELGSDDVDEISLKLENMFGDRLGVGSGRMVFNLSDKCVLKVSKKLNPFQNKSEALSYTEKLSESQKEMFAPVVNWSNDYRWLTMIKSERRPTDEEFREAAETLVVQHGIDITDFQKANFGVVNDRTVIIDYGTGTGMIGNRSDWDSREEAWDYIKDELVFNSVYN